MRREWGDNILNWKSSEFDFQSSNFAQVIHSSFSGFRHEFSVVVYISFQRSFDDVASVFVAAIYVQSSLFESCLGSIKKVLGKLEFLNWTQTNSHRVFYGLHSGLWWILFPVLVNFCALEEFFLRHVLSIPRIFDFILGAQEINRSFIIFFHHSFIKWNNNLNHQLWLSMCCHLMSRS